jgi:DHA2 family multidrug resistance protein
MSSAAHLLPRHPRLVTISVMLASLLYSIDWTIAAVALPHMQGAFSATHDQIGWVITSYIVASAIAIPTAGWLSVRYGRKRLFVWAMLGFTIASVFCGASETLAMEVASRIAQGMCGAFLIPLSHAVILDTYPPAEHGKAMALWGAGSVFGSFLGPTLGGSLTEYMSWHYIFYINVPFGLLAAAGIASFVPETPRDPHRPFDALGFVSLGIAIGSFQLMLDRGGSLDWFESQEIVIEACLVVSGLYVFITHSLTTDHPFLHLALFTQRNFVLGLGFVFMYGLLTVPPLVLMPTFLQEIRGYPIDTIGLLQAPRGVGMLFAMIVGGKITGRIDPRPLIALGLLCIAGSAAEMSTWNADVGVWPLVWTNFVQGVGGGIILVPIQVIAFPGIAPTLRTEAAATYNLIRSIGASIGVSAALTLFVRGGTTERSRLAEHLTPYSEALNHAGDSMTRHLGSLGGLARLDHARDLQAAMMSYVADFRLLAFAALAGLPLLLLVRKPAPPSLEDTVAAAE